MPFDTFYDHLQMREECTAASVNPRGTFIDQTERTWGEYAVIKRYKGGVCTICTFASIQNADHILVSVDDYIWIRAHKMVTSKLKHLLKAKAVFSNNTTAGLSQCKCSKEYLIF